MARPPFAGRHTPLTRCIPPGHGDSSSRRARTASSVEPIAWSVIARVVVLSDWEAAAELENPTQADTRGPNDTGPYSVGHVGGAGCAKARTQNPLTSV